MGHTGTKMIQVFDIREGLDISGELEALLPRLPQWRLEKVLSYRLGIDRFLCAKSFLMLEEMLRIQYGMDRCPEFSLGSKGKPYLRDYPDIHFSISHCRRGIACSVLDRPVGIDIEEIQKDDKLADLVLNPEELASMRESDEPEVRFTELWTLKESYLKLTGEGLRNNMKDVLTETEDIHFDTVVNRPAGYAYSQAYDTTHYLLKQ